MALATYANLKTAIGTWLSRVDQTSNIPDFITLCHDKLMRTLRTREMETIDAALSIGAESVNIPSLWLETRTIYVTSSSPRVQLQYISSEKMVEWFADGSTGIPKFFTVVGGTFRFAPIPDTTYTATHVYYAGLAQMSADSDHNWILDSHPDLYLYGSLLEAMPLIQDDSRMPLWKQSYDEALTLVMRQSSLAKTGPAMQIRPG